MDDILLLFQIHRIFMSQVHVSNHCLNSWKEKQRGYKAHTLTSVYQTRGLVARNHEGKAQCHTLWSNSLARKIRTGAEFDLAQDLILALACDLTLARACGSLPQEASDAELNLKMKIKITLMIRESSPTLTNQHARDLKGNANQHAKQKGLNYFH